MSQDLRSELICALSRHYKIYGYEKQHYLKEILEKHLGVEFKTEIERIGK